MIRSLILAAGLSLSLWAAATPGGLDAAGCHHSKKTGYHCHPERYAKPSRPPAVQARTAEERRLARECWGRPNAGACAGLGL